MNSPNINVTPLIDVLLVLLIIFMVVTPVKPSRFEARVPSEPTKDPRVRVDPRTLVLEIDADRTLKVNGQRLNASVDEPSNAIDRLKAIFSDRERNLETERTVFIKAPPSLNFGSVARVVDAAKLSGARPISLQIDRLD